VERTAFFAVGNWNRETNNVIDDRRIFRLIAAGAAFIALTPFYVRPVLASPQTLEGVVSDSMCGKKHMLPGKTDGQCSAECVKASAKYALVVGDKVYMLSGPLSEFQKYAGQRAHVTSRRTRSR